MSKRVLLTGAGGFIGCHCVEYFLENTDWELVCIDSFRHKGTYRRLDEVTENLDRVKIFRHDLAVPIDHQLTNLILEVNLVDGQVVSKPIDYIINMASESAVERSAFNPVSCLKNNFDLGVNMLEFARKIKPEIFFQVSTDEVYGEAGKDEAHSEWDVILPSNPYAASKAAQEAIAIAYWRTYDVPVVITNTMNNIGERQDPEKFLPKIIEYVATGKVMPIYADNEDSIGSRFYLHAKNHADAFMFLAQQPVPMYSEGSDRPARYNICGDVEMNNLELAKLVADIIGRDLKYELIPSESARRGYDRRYALHGAKMRDLGWSPPISFRESIEKCVRWTLDHPHWLI